jgi:hypothetical protein
MAMNKPVAKPLTARRQRESTRKRRSTRIFRTVVTYLETEHRYRIDHFLSAGELPFFAMLVCEGNGLEVLSRHATLHSAVVACDRHRRERVGGAPTPRVRFFPQTEPIPQSEHQESSKMDSDLTQKTPISPQVL